MGKDSRISKIQEWEEKNHSKLIVYFLGDRPGLETKIGNDVYPLFYDILRSFNPKIKKDDKLDLLIYSTGGITIAGYYIANLIKEFVNEFSVIVPYKAHSAATLLTLGAKNIYMSKLGQLTPIDPSVNSPYNPPTPGQQQSPAPSFLPVSVEDCIGYLKLAKSEAEIKGENLKDIFIALSNDIRPMALGSVYRAREQIRLLAKKLLEKNVEDTTKIDRIVNSLTENLLSHDYFISNTEAKSLELNIMDLSDDEERLVWEIYTEYKNDLKLDEKFNLEVELGNSSQVTVTSERALIENEILSYSYTSERLLERITISRPGGIPDSAIRQRNLFEGWKQI